ncbi:unnamed protein product [Didymodactylos carnosus]|uniref:Oxidoreductase NAD-binding domain-containing protein 1 n=1 Tax=Didymodactylos carnosus TaxID=1234261 RepID=A0A813T0U8_9BILA|nr:unnamed protein product [Didymodactylos carnosus]CAF0803668.1 unnamed protein product [Didymodactylos carnosus]CAF3506260.1 unnamed protein product [Didymodactylos carnosus]CAF3588946.1 unnamed protein product [Didymodactylos carnosus]
MSSNRLESFGTDNDGIPLYEATVQSIEPLSPTIKRFRLSINDNGSQQKLTFRPGQFLDFYFPPSITSIITGYSICNSPYDYQKCSKQIELAIKNSEYPPTNYMHEHCKIGEKIGVKSGGDFYYQNSNGEESVLLICAGVGVNPIVSILRHICDILKSNITNELAPYRTKFLYTARSNDELVFKSEIENECYKDKNVVQTQYFVTREMTSSDTNVNYRRITKTEINEAIQWLSKPVKAYICGPPAFIDSIVEILTSLNVKNTLYEKWW